MRAPFSNGGGSWLKRAACGLAVGAALLTTAPLNALACTQVWVPNQSTRRMATVTSADQRITRHVT